MRGVTVVELFGKWLIRILSAVLIITLVILLLPHLGTLTRFLLPEGDPVVTSTLLRSKMEEVGKLTVVEYTDEHVLNARKSAVFFDAQSVTFPYTYHVALGIDLKEVRLLVQDNRLHFFVPKASVMYDDLIVTGEMKKWDLFMPFTQSEYQKLIDEERFKRKEEYLQNEELMTMAWNQTVDAMKGLFSQWLKEADASWGELELVFQSDPI